MKKCFKLLGIALFATTLCFSMASCGDKEETSTEQGGGGGGEGGGDEGGGDEGGGGGQQDNTFEGMTEGTMKIMFDVDGTDQVMDFVADKYYSEHSALRETILWATAATSGNWTTSTSYQFTKPWFQIVTSLTGGRSLSFYTNYYSTNCEGWENLIVTYQNGAMDTFQVGDYFFDENSCGSITVDKFNYNALPTLRRLSVRVVVPMISTADALSGSDNPTIGHLTLLIYKMTMDEFPQQGKSAGVKMPTITNRHNDRVVGYSRL